jgi:hypothetical protein
LPPLVIVLGSSFWLWKSLDVAREMPLGGDHGIFQYIAWSLGQGERMYESYREMNGPGTAVFHVLFQALGGSDDRTFRLLDLVLNGAAFAFFGACVPGFVGSRRAPHLPAAPALGARLGFAAAAFTILMTAYLRLGFWGTAQRESFAMCLLLPSLGLTLVGQAEYRGELAQARLRRQRMQLLLAGALGALIVLVKPTFALFTLTQLLGIYAGAPRAQRKRHMGYFVGSACASLLLACLLLWPFADLTLWLSYLREGHSVYRFMWNAKLTTIWGSDYYGSHLVDAAVLGTIGIAGVVYKVLPRRFLVVMLLPFAAVLHITLQHKGFHYHHIPLIELSLAAWLVLTVLAFELALRRVRDRLLGGALALLPILVFAMVTANAAAESAMTDLWVIRDPDRPEHKRGSKEFYKLFSSRHTPFIAQKDAARWLRAHTTPEQRIQVYGRDPWVLFLAERLSATPYLYATELNLKLSLAGSGLVVPDAAEKEHIRAIAKAHDHDLLTRIRKRPPAYFVFIDGKGLMPMADAAKDFKRHVPQSGAWVFARYSAAKTFGPIRIYGPKTAATPNAQAQSVP